MKKQIVDLTIEDMVFPGKGIGYYDGKKVFVTDGIPGQKVQILLRRKRKTLEGTILSLLEPSSMEEPPACPHFPLCGGCRYQHIPYTYELSLKEKMVLDLFHNANIPYDSYEGIVGAPHIDGYRNKMEFSFGDTGKDGPLALGMRRRNHYYEVVTAAHCRIIDENFRQILLTTLQYFQDRETFYHRATHEGALRYLVARKGEFTGDILVNLITSSTLSTSLTPLKEQLLALPLSGNITGILHTKTDSVADVAKGTDMAVLHGSPNFMETILQMDFEISPYSFFQTNSAGAQLLYQTVQDWVTLVPNQLVYDLYCGTGTISQILSPGAKQVVGIELVPEAVAVAQENAKRNLIKNCTFIAGDVLKEIDNLPHRPDVIVLDPPREGIHPKAIQKIIEYKAGQIIYVSCKPTSLVRDLAILTQAGYQVKKVKCHDMFPRTAHVETVVLLSKLNSSKSIEVEIDLNEMDLTKAESKATYAEIKEYVLENAGFKVSQLYIAQVKRKHDLIERINYNIGENKAKAPQVPLEKAKAIEDALRYFKMIE